MATPLTMAADISTLENGSDHASPSSPANKQEPLLNGDGQSAVVFHAAENAEANISIGPATTDQTKLIQRQASEPTLERASIIKKTNSTPSSSSSRVMGHFPPRRESRQESHFRTESQSQLTESLHELSNQFEESVGKPSREALHKFFYPPGNNTASPSPSRRQSKAQKMSPRIRQNLKKKLETEPGLPCLPLKEHNPAAEHRNMTIHRSCSGDLSDDSITDLPPDDAWNHNHPSSLMQPNSSSAIGLQQSFDAEEERDRKYVEGFWRTYDDIVMMSLFTQLGVVARLVASTWISYFDGGVFRSDSPLFTNLPLNCLSCFVLGLLGSGDRLMEMVTTRFTPRKLQQGLLHEDCSGRDDEDEDDDADEEAPKEGARRRKRRSKRAKKKPFHSWEPPLHWHDDLREVQLLALERRIRASKCLLLFPVAKEDADVVEHYFGEGYQASAAKEQRRRRRTPKGDNDNAPNRSKKIKRRRRFGKQRYAATNLAEIDENNLHQSGSSWCDSCGEECEESESHNTDSENQEYEDDGRFRFDLELTEDHQRAQAATASPTDGCESEQAKAGNATNPASPISSIPPSVQKLIKRSPGLSGDRTTRTSSAQSALSPITSQDKQHASKTPAGSQSSSVPPTAVEGTPCNLPEMTQQSADSPIHAGTTETGAGVKQRAYSSDRSVETLSGGEVDDPQLEQIISNVQANVSENINRIRRVNLADGWDVGTTPEDMADDLMLGLRDGFCGALSSFSSWNSSMLDLLREGQFGAAVVGYILGIQLPIVAYRFGQQVSVYIFVWRCRREARRDERKGWYGIRVRMDDDGDCESSPPTANNRSEGRSSFDESFEDEPIGARSVDSEENAVPQEVPSIRAICTALFLLALVTQCTSLSFFSNPAQQQIAFSLLFSPFGTLARWRLSQFNCWWPGFPLGTFTCNIVACALGGSLGSLLAGNPGPRERILLQSFIAGFGGTLSSLATFVVEILAGMDPLLFRFDGLIYAFCSIAWALIVGFIFEASVDWADATT